MGETQFLAYIPHFTPTSLDVTISDMPTGGLSHGPGARWAGNPLLGCGIQSEHTIILPSLSILPFHRPYRFGIYPNPTYTIYPFANQVAANPTAWVSAWRRVNWPRNQRITSRYMISRPVGASWSPILMGRYVPSLVGTQPIEYSPWSVSDAIDMIDPYPVGYIGWI